MTRYPAYRYFGLPWLDSVPGHWETARVDHLFTLRSDEPLPDDEVVTAFIDGTVTLRKNVKESGLKNAFSDQGWQRILPGDVAVSGMNAHLGGIGVCDAAGKCSPIYIVLVPKQGTNADYFSQVLRLIASSGFLRAQVQTIRYNSADLHPADLKLLYLPLPPRAEQDAIVAYLDRKLAGIDDLIAKKQRLIALLREQRAAVINRAVTRGLDPTVPTKPSGIPWLGDIPAHWKMVRCKTLFQEVSSRTSSGEGVLLSLRMNEGLVPHEEVSDKPVKASGLIGFKSVNPGEMVMNRMRAASGLFALVETPGLVSPDYAIFRVASGISGAYYVHLFKTPVMQAIFRSKSRGLGTGESGFLRLYTDSFGSILVPRPPLEEQQAILDAIAERSARFNSAIGSIEREIELLRELRAALIAEAVTGKIDVRAYQAPSLLGEGRGEVPQLADATAH